MPRAWVWAWMARVRDLATDLALSVCLAARLLVFWRAALPAAL